MQRWRGLELIPGSWGRCVIRFHVGSQCEDAYAYERHIAAAAKIAEEAGIELKRLNIGGGYPAPYPTSEAPPMDYYFETIAQAVKDNFGKSGPELIIEPGRALVTSSTSLLLRVKHQRGGAVGLSQRRRLWLADGSEVHALHPAGARLARPARPRQ